MVKTAVFTILVPGTVAGYIPVRLTRGGLLRPPTAWQAYVGVLPVAFGIALYLWCAWNFAVAGRGTPAPIDPPQTLVVKGPYRLTRNPMYVAVLSVLTGEVLLAWSSRLAAYALMVFVGFYCFVVFYEEPILGSKFGPAYKEYCANVPRWLVKSLPKERPPRGGCRP